MTAPTAKAAATGQLTPTASPATGPAWEATTTSPGHAQAIAAAIPGTTTERTGPAQWTARIPRPTLAITATAADDAGLTCQLDDAPGTSPLTLPFDPWTAAEIITGPAQFPAPGRLTIRDIRLSTRMGRNIRYLIPAFTPTERRKTPGQKG